MKRMLLVLALAGGIMGCDAGEKLRNSQKPKVNPLTVLDQSLGMREAVCQYGLQTQQFMDRDECRKFWKRKQIELESEIREYNRRNYGNPVYLPNTTIQYAVRADGVTLMMFVPTGTVDQVYVPKVAIMSGKMIDIR